MPPSTAQSATYRSPLAIVGGQVNAHDAPPPKSAHQAPALKHETVANPSPDIKNHANELDDPSSDLRNFPRRFFSDLEPVIIDAARVAIMFSGWVIAKKIYASGFGSPDPSIEQIHVLTTKVLLVTFASTLALILIAKTVKSIKDMFDNKH